MKRVLILPLCILLAVVLLACGGEQGGSSVPTTAPAQPSRPTQAATVTTRPTTVPTEPTTYPTEPTTAPTEPDFPFDEEESAHLFGLWRTEQTFDADALGLPKLKDSLKLTVYVEFDDLGHAFFYVERAKAEKAFHDFFSRAAVIKQVKDSCYAIFKEQGLSQKEADQYVKDTYGKTMDQYVKMTIESVYNKLDIDNMATNTRYYSEGKKLYILSSDLENWEEYTIDVQNGTMTIKEATSPDGTFFLLGSVKELPKKLTSANTQWA